MMIGVDDCAADSCSNGGHCVDGHMAYTCDCSGTGYTGDTCDIGMEM